MGFLLRNTHQTLLKGLSLKPLIVTIPEAIWEHGDEGIVGHLWLLSKS